MTAVLESSSLPIVLVILFLLLGTAIGFVISFGLSKRRGSNDLTTNKSLASSSELKSHICSLEFERSLTAQALSRVSEAMNQGNISSLDHGRLVLQYEKKLKNLEEKIAELRSTSDLFELQNLRDDLNCFLQNKMKQLDEKLSRLYPIKTQPGSATTLRNKFATRQNINGISQNRDHSRFHSLRRQALIDQEKKVEATQKEIMIALERLGNEEVNQKVETKTIENKNRDALASFDRG